MNALAPSNVTAVSTTQTMQAMVYRQYGGPEVLRSEELARPVPGEGQVLVRVHAAGVTVGDEHVISGKPYLIRLSPFGGLPGPRNKVPGAVMSGRVESVGAEVTAFRPGDEVFGQAPFGAFAQYVLVSEKVIAPKPTNLSFEQAAVVPWAATALQGFRAAGLKAGQRVLINGASGGVGTWAVQLAKAMGAHVTAVCSTRNVELVRGLGADEVIDYSTQDFVSGGARFEMMFDLVGNRSLADSRSVLVPGGSFIPCGGGGDWVFRLIGGLLMSLFSSRKLKMFVMAPNQADLLFLKDLVESGKAKPVIDQTFALNELGAALAHVAKGHGRGQTVIRVA